VHFNCIFYSKFDFNIVTTFLCSMSSAARMSGTHGHGLLVGLRLQGVMEPGIGLLMERGDTPVKVLLIDHSYVRRLHATEPRGTQSGDSSDCCYGVVRWTRRGILETG